MSQYGNEGMPKPGLSDEIDLREVFDSFGRFFTSLGTGVLNMILFFRRVTIRFAVLLIVLMVIGAITGFIFYGQSAHYYKARMVIDSKYYNYELLESIVNNLNEQARLGAVQVLSNELNLTEDKVANLRGLSIESLMPLEEKVNLISYIRRIQENARPLEEAQLDSLKDRLLLNASQYIITAEVYDNSIISELQNGLLEYLSSRDYVAKRVRVERENLEMLKKSIEEDEQSLARLKNEMVVNVGGNKDFIPSGSNTIYMGTVGEAVSKNIYQQSNDLYVQKARINQQLQLSQEVELVSDFVPIEKPASLSLIEQVFQWALAGVVLAYILILMMVFNKSLNNYEKERKPNEIRYS